LGWRVLFLRKEDEAESAFAASHCWSLRFLHHMKRELDGLYHPATEGDVQALVRQAIREGKQLRVRGSLHSPATRVMTDAWLAGRPRDAVDLSLDRLDAVIIDSEARTVRVQGGCRLGRDPRDPSGRSTLASGLCPQLDQAGFALRVLGGITHQTIAGYLATGSAGGSFTRSLHDDLLAVRLVTGDGELLELNREDGARFFAAATSLGLLGVVTEVTLRVVPRFWVVGQERTLNRADAPFTLSATGPRSLEFYFQQHDFARVLWWPQPKVDRLVLWTADARDWSERPDSPVPYHAMPPLLGSSVPTQVAAAVALRAIGDRPQRLTRWLERKLGGRRLQPLMERGLARVYRAFVEPGTQAFSDTWWRAMPQDDSIEEALLPVDMTEVWVPVARAPEALDWLQHLLTRRGFLHSGTFAIELYPGPKSDCLLSPGCEGPAIRINPFFLRVGAAEERAHFFEPFFELAQRFGGRHHWGKHLPPRAVSRDFPQAARFLEVRAQLDPHGLFLTDSLRAHVLGEGSARAEPVQQTPLGRTPFRIQPVDARFFDQAPELVVASAPLRSSPEKVLEVWASNPADYVRGCTHFRMLSGSFDEAGAVAEETVAGLSLRMRVLCFRAAREHAVSVERLNLPFARRFGIDLRIVDGRAVLRFAVELQPALARFAPLIRPGVEWFAAGLLEDTLAEAQRREAAVAPSPTVGGWTVQSSYSGLHSVLAEHHAVSSVAEAARVLANASRQGRRVVVRGAGLSFDRHALLGDVSLSLRGLAAISVDLDECTVTAQAGARWVDVVRACEPHGLMPVIVPSSSDITVAGSASVNSMSRFSPVWGREGRSVRRLELLTVGGERVLASRACNPELFYAAVGGLGQVGVVLSVTYQLLPQAAPMRVRSRVEKVRGLDTLGTQLACPQSLAPNARTRFAVVSFTDGGERRVLLTSCDYVDHHELYTMLPHRPGGVGRIPLELALHWHPPAGQAFWNYAFETYVEAERDYIDDLYGFTFFMDGNNRARRTALALGLPFRVAQQAWALPVAKGDATLSAFIDGARRASQSAGLALSLVDVLTLPRDEPFVFSATACEPMHVVTLTWEGLASAAQAGAVREVCVDLSSEALAQGGRVHLTKNVFARPAELRAMYREELRALSAAKQAVDPTGVLGSDFVDALFGRISATPG
jgi:FAD/FMN-containing dehydrogenase